MALLELDFPWDSQPQEPSEASGELSGAIVWTAPDRLGISGARALRSASEGSFNGLASGQLGLSASWARNASAGVDFGLVQPLDFTPASGITIAVVAAPVSAAAVRSPISFRKGSGSTEQIAVLFNATGAFSTTAGYATMYTRNTAGTATAVSASAGGIDGGLHCWVFGNSDASGYIYRDGAALSLGTSTRPSGALVSTSQKLRVGNVADYTTDGAFVHSDPLLLVIAWPRLLPAAEAAEWSRRLARNLGEAFEPQSIPVYVAGAGGGVAGTLAATESGSDTAALAGAVAVAGTMAATEAGSDAAAIAGTVTVAGALAAAEIGSDSAEIVGAGALSTVTGSLAAAESGSDIAAIAGDVYVTGTFAATETGSDTAAITNVAAAGFVKYFDVLSGNLLILRAL